jgi:hypothetical protein
MIVMDNNTNKTYSILSPQNKELAISKFKKKKDLIATGTYAHPQDGWRMHVDNATLQQYVNKFEEMKENGVKVPVTKTHDYTNPDNLLGYVDELFVEDNTCNRLSHFVVKYLQN